MRERGVSVWGGGEGAGPRICCFSLCVVCMGEASLMSHNAAIRGISGGRANISPLVGIRSQPSPCSVCRTMHGQPLAHTALQFRHISLTC